MACLVHEAAQIEQDEPLRVLEVGGGTGGLTEVVLEATVEAVVSAHRTRSTRPHETEAGAWGPCMWKVRGMQ